MHLDRIELGCKAHHKVIRLGYFYPMRLEGVWRPLFIQELFFLVTDR